MIKSVVPSYKFSSFTEAVSTLKEHSFRNLFVPMSSLSTTPDGVLRVEGSEYDITDMSIKPLAGVVGLPVKNLQILSNERISEDLNYLFKSCDNTHVSIRLVDNVIYDIQKRKTELEIPVDNVLFLERVMNDMPELLEQNLHNLSFQNGRLNITTRNYGSDVEPIPGDVNSVGLQIVNSDHGQYYTQVTYHIYRRVCANSAVGIDAFRFKPRAEGDVIGEIVNKGVTMLKDTSLLCKAYRLLNESPISDYSFSLMRNSLRSNVGTKNMFELLGDYLMVAEEEEFLPTGKSRRKKFHVLDEKIASKQTEYDLLNHVTNRAKSLDGDLCWKAQMSAGCLVTNYVMALRNKDEAVS